VLQPQLQKRKLSQSSLYYDVNLNTVGLAATSFSAFDDLEEDEVLQWCIDADTDN
jgi:hypothetical protein